MEPRIRPTDSTSSLGRSPVMQIVRLPSLGQLHSRGGGRPKSPLLILRLSSSSFLHAAVEDETRHVLYSIRTTSNLTTIMRSDPWEGMTKIADVRWPESPNVHKGKGKKSDGVQVQMRGHRWVDGETFLRSGSGSSPPRKFSIPNCSHTLKWRQTNSSYWCTSPSVKGPIAILESAMESLPPQLQIFETIHDKYDGRRMMDHNGVSILLIDYLLTTSLLLLTEPQEWMRNMRRDQINASSSCTDVSCPIDSPGPRSSNGVPMASASQWRKIMYGEPIYPKHNTRSLSGSAASSPTIPTPPDKLAKVMHGVPIYPKLLSAVNFDSDSDSDPEDEGSFTSPEPPGPTSLPTTPGQEYSAENESESSHSNRSLASIGAIDNPDNSLHRAPSTSIHSTPSRFSQIRNTAPASPTSGLPSEMYRRSASQICRPRSTPPSSALPATPDVPPPLPGPSIVHDIRRPSLPSNLNGKPTARSRPLPVPPGGGHPAWVLAQQQGPSGIQLPDKFGSYNSRILPSRPPQSPLPQINNTHASQHAVDAGPLNPYSYPPHYYPVSPHATHFQPPFEHPPLPPRQKTPDGTDLVQWMGGLGATSRLQPEEENPPPAAPYDVPPPPYTSINFDK